MQPRDVPLDSTRFFFYRIFFLLLLLQSLGAVILLPAQQATTKTFDNFYLLGVLILFSALWAFLLYTSLRVSPWLQTFDRRLSIWALEAERWRLILFICFACILIGGTILFAVHQESFYFFAPPTDPDHTDTVALVNLYFEKAYPLLRLFQPVAVQMAGFGLLAALFFPIAFFGVRRWHHGLKRHHLYFIGGIFGFFLLAWLLIGGIGIQLHPDYSRPGWYTLGAPILDSQFLLTMAVGVAAVGAWLVYTRAGKKPQPAVRRLISASRIDLVLGVAIWLLAAAHWLSIPMQVSWFVAPPRAPNYEYYPNSDAYLYDTTAQSLIVGAGYKSGNLEYPLRPFYALFIALLHGLSGQNYESVSGLQAGILAVFPAIIYLIASRLHSRLSGLLASLLVILREGNAISLADKITVSNPRMFMAEMPAAICVSLFLLVAIAWFKQPRVRQTYSLLIGAIIAAALLIRIETMVMIPLFLVFVLLFTYRALDRFLKHVILVSVGATLFLAPWVYRNWRTTGLIYLERPGERLTYFLVRSGAAALQTSTGAPPVSAGAPAPGFTSQLRSYYLNSQIQAVLLFPAAYRFVDSGIAFLGLRDISRFTEVCCSRENYINRLPFWNWGEWKGGIPGPAVVPILVNLLLLSTGIACIWNRNRLAGLFPMLAAVTHYLISATVRVSGGRFVQLVDWIWILYYSAGISVLILGGYSFFLRLQASGTLVEQASPTELRTASQPIDNTWRKILPLTLMIFMLGLSIPAAEWIIQPRYTQQSQEQQLEELLDSPFIQQHPGVLEKLNRVPELERYVYQGRALYPRYHRAGQGESGITVTPFTQKDFSRFSFFLVGSHNAGILMPVESAPEVDFANASDVLVLGCQDQGFVRAHLVYVHPTQTVMISSTFEEAFPCKP